MVVDAPSAPVPVQAATSPTTTQPRAIRDTADIIESVPPIQDL
jgi:hypothetical protein